MQDRLRANIFPSFIAIIMSVVVLFLNDVHAASAPIYAQQAPVSLDAAATMVRRISGGRIVGADAMDDNGKVVYRIKVLLPEGRVRVYLVDPNTGQLLDS